MSVQPPQTLRDACEFIVDCLHATAPTEADGYPLIRTPNISKGRLDLPDVYRVSEETYQTWTKRAVPEPGDLILAREAPAGNVAVVKEGEKVCLGQRTVHLRPNRAKVDPTFLCYFLLAPPQQGKLLAGETGATAKHVNMKDIRRLELVGLPSLSTQRTAGSLLAAYDDLFERTTDGGWRCWRKRRGSSTVSGSSASASPATSTPASPTACRRDGNGRRSAICASKFVNP